MDKKLSVQQSSKLTNIDKQIVKAGRVLFAAWQNVIFMIKPGKILLKVDFSYYFLKNIMRQGEEKGLVVWVLYFLAFIA